MGKNNAVFLEMIEWFDPTGEEMVHRIPEKGSGEIKFGAQLVVRESQVGVFFYNGKAIQVFGPGRHTLKTGNIPVLNKIMAIPWGFTSPLRAEVYYVNMKVFTGWKWGTRHPVAFKDSELGLIRIRAFGQFTVQVVQPLLFVNSIVGTVPSLSTMDITEYFSDLLVSRLNDHLGEHLDSIFNLPGTYAELSKGLQQRLQQDLARFGLAMPHMFINSITPPQEVQRAIDDRSKLGLFKDLGDLTRLKTAMAVEKAADNPAASGQGMGMGLGMMMPAMLSQYFQPQARSSEASPTTDQQICPDCGHSLSRNAHFCMYCGHQILVFRKCTNCAKNLTPNAKFCVRCGTPAEQKESSRKCPHCSADILSNSVFCNQCGERI